MFNVMHIDKIATNVIL